MLERELETAETDIRNCLKREGYYEVHRKIMSFKGHRNTASGKTEKVTIDVFDSGPDAFAPTRYWLEVVSENGASARGNGGESIATALSTQHWGELDHHHNRTDADIGRKVRRRFDDEKGVIQKVNEKNRTLTVKWASGSTTHDEVFESIDVLYHQ